MNSFATYSGEILFLQVKTLLFACQPGKSENRCQINTASKNRYPSMLIPILKFTKINILPCLSPYLLKTELMSCTDCIKLTLFLDIKQKGKFYIYAIL